MPEQKLRSSELKVGDIVADGPHDKGHLVIYIDDDPDWHGMKRLHFLGGGGWSYEPDNAADDARIWERRPATDLDLVAILLDHEARLQEVERRMDALEERQAMVEMRLF